MRIPIGLNQLVTADRAIAFTKSLGCRLAGNMLHRLRQLEERTMPRRLLSFCFLIAILGLFSTSLAEADDLFTYQFGGNTFTWELPASPPIVTPPDTAMAGMFFELVGVQFSENNGPQAPGTFDFFQAPDNLGGFELFPMGNSNPIVNTVGPQLYTGGEGSPTFKLGTFDLNDFVTGAPAGSLKIRSTPEPSSLLLLGTGALALLGFARKRIIAQHI
jgi:hypothetical protein